MAYHRIGAWTVTFYSDGVARDEEEISDAP